MEGNSKSEEAENLIDKTAHSAGVITSPARSSDSDWSDIDTDEHTNDTDEETTDRLRIVTDSAGKRNSSSNLKNQSKHENENSECTFKTESGTKAPSSVKQ